MKHNFKHGPRTRCVSKEARLTGTLKKDEWFYPADWMIQRDLRTRKHKAEMIAALEEYRRATSG